MNEQSLLSKILIGINIVFLMLYVLLGALHGFVLLEVCGGYIILVLSFVPIIALYFEISWKNRFDENKIKQMRVMLNIANIIVLLILIYNIYLIWLILTSGMLTQGII